MLPCYLEVAVMAEQENSSKSFDPLESFRAVRDAWLDSMAKSMVDAVNTDAYAQATGSMLEGYLSAAAPMREAVDKSMTQALQQLSLPSRQELAALAERFTNVEMRLDDMDAKLDRIVEALGQLSPAREAAPTKTAAEPAAERTETDAPAKVVASATRRRTAQLRRNRKTQR
jgi:hypothetical protein